MHLPVSRVVVLGFGAQSDCTHCHQRMVRGDDSMTRTRTNHQTTVTLLTWKRQEWIWNYFSNSSLICLSEHLLLKVISTFLDGKKFQQALGSLCMHLSLVTTFSSSCFKKHLQTFRWILKKLGSTSIQHVLLLVGSSRVLITIQGFRVQLCESLSLYYFFLFKFMFATLSSKPCPAAVCSSPCPVTWMLVRVRVLLLKIRFLVLQRYVRSHVLLLPVPAAVSSKFESVTPCPAAVVRSSCPTTVGSRLWPAIVGSCLCYCRFASVTCCSTL